MTVSKLIRKLFYSSKSFPLHNLKEIPTFGKISTYLLYFILHLFSPLGKLADRNLFCFILFFIFLLWAKLSQYPLDRFSQFFFTKWKVFVWIFSIRSSFYRFLGTLPWQPILWQNYLPPALIALAFQNGMGYRYLNVRINSWQWNNFVTRFNYLIKLKRTKNCANFWTTLYL